MLTSACTGKLARWRGADPSGAKEGGGAKVEAGLRAQHNNPDPHRQVTTAEVTPGSSPHSRRLAANQTGTLPSAGSGNALFSFFRYTDECNAKRHTYKPAADAHSSRGIETRELPATNVCANNQSTNANRESGRALRPRHRLAEQTPGDEFNWNGTTKQQTGNNYRRY